MAGFAQGMLNACCPPGSHGLLMPSNSPIDVKFKEIIEIEEALSVSASCGCRHRCGGTATAIQIQTQPVHVATGADVPFVDLSLGEYDVLLTIGERSSILKTDLKIPLAHHCRPIVSQEGDLQRLDR
jgi:hypothetical protein